MIDRAEQPSVVVHLPHASTTIPPEVREQFVLDDGALAEEQRRLVDHFTDELFALPQVSATTVAFPVSRFVVDPERFVDPQGYLAAVQQLEKAYLDQLAKERSAK